MTPDERLDALLEEVAALREELKLTRAALDLARRRLIALGELEHVPGLELRWGGGVA